MTQRSLKFFHRWELKVNSLWLWCYCVFVLAAQGYLMYRAVKRCRDYNELSWRTSEKPVSELYAYICLIVISVMCMPFFIISAVFKIGCYSNDGTRLGRDNVLHHLSVETSSEQRKLQRVKFFKDVWRHMGPVSQLFHVLAAFALLLPMSLVESQEIKFGFREPERMWASELEALYGSSEYTLRSKPSDVIANSTDTPSYSALSPTTPSPIEAGPVVVTAEFVNYVLALLIYSVRYAAVYWYTSATFSAVFTAALLLTSLHYVYAYCGMQILYKFAVNDHAVEDIDLLLTPAASMTLHVIACVITFAAPLAIFNYGYCLYVESCRRFLKQHFPTYARYVAKMPVGCHGYVPHSLATVALVMFVAFRSPIVYDYVEIYRETGFPILLTCIIVDAAYMVLWIALWFGLTLKQRWEFRINPQMDMLHSLQRAALVAANQNAAVTSQSTTAQAPSQQQTPAANQNGVSLIANGGSDNSRQNGSASLTQQQQPQQQHNTVQVIDRPPPYNSHMTNHARTRTGPDTSASTNANLGTSTNNDADEETIKVRSKSARKRLQPLRIDTSDRAKNMQSPHKQLSPSHQQLSPSHQQLSPSHQQLSPSHQHQHQQKHHSPKRSLSPTMLPDNRATSSTSLSSPRRSHDATGNVKRTQHSPTRVHGASRGPANTSPRQRSPEISLPTTRMHARTPEMQQQFYSRDSSPNKAPHPLATEHRSFPCHESPLRTSPDRHVPPRSTVFPYPSVSDVTDAPNTPLTDLSTPNTPASPATSALKKSGLRKSGERRHNAPQRVTFDDSVNRRHDNNEAANHQELPVDVGQLSPASLQRARQSTSPHYSYEYDDTLNPGLIKNGIPLQSINVLQVADTRRTPPAVSGYNGRLGTPDSTLTRNYRSSIRDKCGQYYKQIGDIGIPPAAQSSPIPYQQPQSEQPDVQQKPSQPRPLSDNYDQRELLLSPLTFDDDVIVGYEQNNGRYYYQKNNRHAQPPPQPHERNLSEIELTGYYENGKANDPKSRSTTTMADRQSGRRSYNDDRHFSYPPSLLQHLETNNTQSSSELSSRANGHRLRAPADTQYPPFNQQNNGTDAAAKMSQSNSRIHDLSNNTRDAQKYARQISRDIARDLNKQFQPISDGVTNQQQQQQPRPNGAQSSRPQYHSSHQYLYSGVPSSTSASHKTTDANLSEQIAPPKPQRAFLEPSRELTILKPDLNRRDSALPSSNETSSNDSSENVLCSQV